MFSHPQGSEAESPVLTDKPFLLWLSHPHGTPWMIGRSPQPVIWTLQRGIEKLSRGKGCLQPPFSRLVSVQRAERHKSNSPSPECSGMQSMEPMPQKPPSPAGWRDRDDEAVPGASESCVLPGAAWASLSLWRKDLVIHLWIQTAWDLTHASFLSDPLSVFGGPISEDTGTCKMTVDQVHFTTERFYPCFTSPIAKELLCPPTHTQTQVPTT